MPLIYRLQYLALSVYPNVHSLNQGTTTLTAQTHWMAMKELLLQFAQDLT
ncbi:hypothetical protein PL9631_1060259 [Planktothrix paucivesiculata PCC 9631]|uniref:Uncharacterized protein n=1 Tax=Planktothrix paucivesiculata PCC 9631 TaxID=671071 RepID=A0A7Z9BGK4_9CYAN|nr:hypothetical protein PL9631_1060259 [Planktothrix paucivesiculata PCC 9631]